MKVLMVHPGPDLPGFSVADVHSGWYEALRKLGCTVASYNLNDRLIFYNMALIDSGERDETGHPIVKSAMTPQQAFNAAMQGLSHACLTFWPDVILYVSGFFLNAGLMQLMRSRRFKQVILHTESPYQDFEQILRDRKSTRLNS